MIEFYGMNWYMKNIKKLIKYKQRRSIISLMNFDNNSEIFSFNLSEIIFAEKDKRC